MLMMFVVFSFQILHISSHFFQVIPFLPHKPDNSPHSPKNNSAWQLRSLMFLQYTFQIYWIVSHLSTEHFVSLYILTCSSFGGWGTGSQAGRQLAQIFLPQLSPSAGNRHVPPCPTVHFISYCSISIFFSQGPMQCCSQPYLVLWLNSGPWHWVYNYLHFFLFW